MFPALNEQNPEETPGSGALPGYQREQNQR